MSFHFGLPSPELLARVKRLGREDAVLGHHRRGGALAGGAGRRRGHRAGPRGGRPPRHVPDATTSRTQVGTFALLPQVVRAVKVPVIAAGGIADAHGVAAAMALGAAGVQVGTAYLLCPEATTSAPAPRGAEERGRARHGAHQPVHRPAGARHREPHHARAGADEPARAGVSAGRAAIAPLARAGPRARAAATSRRCGPARTPAAAARCRRRELTRELAQGLA